MERLCSLTEKMTSEELDEILNRHPKTKAGFAALVLLFEERSKDEDVDIDDWECDTDDIAFGEIVNS